MCCGCVVCGWVVGAVLLWVYVGFVGVGFVVGARIQDNNKPCAPCSSMRADCRSVVLCNRDKPHCHTTPLRTAPHRSNMWAEFEWENKVAINTAITDVVPFLDHIVATTNMKCLTPPSTLDGARRRLCRHHFSLCPPPSACVFVGVFLLLMCCCGVGGTRLPAHAFVTTLALVAGMHDGVTCVRVRACVSLCLCVCVYLFVKLHM